MMILNYFICFRNVEDPNNNHNLMERKDFKFIEQEKVFDNKKLIDTKDLLMDLKK